MEEINKQSPAKYEDKYHLQVHNYLASNPGYYESRARLAFLNYFSEIPSNLSILEFGCGLGQNIYKVKNAAGYDISKFALNFCRKKGISAISNLKKAGKYDIIFSRHVFEHLESPLENLKMLKDHLKEDGKLILIIPYERQESSSLKPDIHQHLYSWNFRTINNLLDRAGYRIVENKVLFFPMGYKKLAFTRHISFGLYDFLTKVVAFLRGARELKIIAIKK